MSNHNNLCRDGIHNTLQIKGTNVIDPNNNTNFKKLKTKSLRTKGPIQINSNTASNLAGFGYSVKIGTASAPGEGGNSVPIIDMDTNMPMMLKNGQFCVGMSGYGDGSNGPGDEILIIRAFGSPVETSNDDTDVDIFGGCFFDDEITFASNLLP